MILLIDAYNILKQFGNTHTISAAERQKFIKQVERYARSRGHEAYIVFDGGDLPRSTQSVYGPIRVIYSGYTSSADDVLKILCQKLQRLSVMLVSSDRDVCSFASFYGIACLDAHLMHELVHEQSVTQEVTMVKSNAQIIKRAGHESSEDIDALMHEAAASMLVKAEDGDQKMRAKAPTTLSKTEKKIKKLVNKL